MSTNRIEPYRYNSDSMLIKIHLERRMDKLAKDKGILIDHREAAFKGSQEYRHLTGKIRAISKTFNELRSDWRALK